MFNNVSINQETGFRIQDSDVSKEADAKKIFQSIFQRFFATSLTPDS
jgi:hypothetical protein